MSQPERETTRRVKVYSYTENASWDDMGTGHVSIGLLERNNAFTIIVRSEENSSVLLESKILPDRAYQKREETLIVWTEDDSCDLAISFQEKMGCDKVWEEICEIQGRNPDLPVTQVISQEGEMSDWFSVELPPCELSRLEEVDKLVVQGLSVKEICDNLSVAIEKEGYIPKLVDLFHVCEDLDNTEGLSLLHKIITGLLRLNKNDLLTIMIQDQETIDGVIGCLEYSPTNKPHVRHRDIVAKMSDREEIIPFSDPSLLPKIHQTYQVQYIRDVLLPTPSLFEEHKLAVLNSFLLFNKSEIVQKIQEDTAFLKQLFEELTDESTPIDKFRQLAELLREINNFATLTQSSLRLKLCNDFCRFGLMKAIVGMLSSEDGVVVPVAVDILQSITSFNYNITWDHMLHDTESSSEDNQLLNIVIGLLIDGEFVEIDVQLVGLIQSIIAPDHIAPDVDSEAVTATTASDIAVEKSLFLKYFYSQSIHRLMAPLMAHTASDKISKDTSTNAVLLSHILDLLSECIERHSYHIRNYIIDKNLLARVLVLMTSSHGHLVLSALRFCRRIIGLKDEFFNRYIIRNNLFAPVVRTFMANGQRYNLINSAIIEVFNFITQAKIKSLITYVVDNFMETLESVEYVDTFKCLKLAYDQEKDRQTNMNAASVEGILHVNRDLLRWRRDPRELDEDEEAWFDDEEESVVTTTPLTSSPVSQPPTITKPSPPLTSSSPFTQLSYSPRPSDQSRPPPGHYSNPPLKSDPPNKPVTNSPALQILVDYDEDSDSDEDNKQLGDTASPAKRQKRL